MKKKKYQKPTIKHVKLFTEVSVLTVCKVASGGTSTRDGDGAGFSCSQYAHGNPCSQDGTS